MNMVSGTLKFHNLYVCVYLVHSLQLLDFNKCTLQLLNQML